MIVSAENGATVARLEGNAETDFVVRNDKFQQFLNNIAHEAAKTAPCNLDAFVQQKYSKEPSMTIDQYRSSLIQTIGENIQIRRLQLVEKSPKSRSGFIPI